MVEKYYLCQKIYGIEIQEKIKMLFKKLDISEQRKVLHELEFKSKVMVSNAKIMPVSSCPYCDSKRLSKNGHRGAVQRYKCKDCQKIFSGTTGTFIHGIKDREKFERYLKIMIEHYLPLKEMAAKVGISIQTAFDWRHKILSGLRNSPEVFKGITEIDDVWFLYSQKGRKGLKYSRKRGGSHRQGDNKYQVKLLITADRQKHKDLSVVKIGRITKADIQRTIGGKFDENSVLVSDRHRSIASFAKSEGIQHKSFKASKHTAGGDFHIQTVNNYSSRLKRIINQDLRGVSTKYLQNYSNWFGEMEEIKSQQDGHKVVKRTLLKKRDTWNKFVNTEKGYKKFIKSYSERTYRCPTQRKWSSNICINKG